MSLLYKTIADSNPASLALRKLSTTIDVIYFVGVNDLQLDIMTMPP